MIERKITVYDAIMGSGKTYKAIEKMKEYLDSDQKFIYITPFLSEVDRVMKTLSSDKVSTPLSIGEKGKGVFKVDSKLINSQGQIDLNSELTYSYLGKRAQFLKLAAQGENIISTHSVFIGLKREDYSFFKDYVLILDEVINPVKVEFIGYKDIKILINEELIVVNDETNEVRFIKEDYNDAAFRGIKTLCESGNIYLIDKCFLVWVFPEEIFQQFQQVKILTYLFEGSILCGYLKLFKLKYTLIQEDESDILKDIAELLNIYDGRSNRCGNTKTSFSKTWCDNKTKARSKLISHIVSNVFKRDFNTKSNENAFTAFKDFQSKFSGSGYTKGFIAVNARATNEFSNKKSMAYLANRYFDPQTFNFFKERGVTLNEDLWALGELLQWVWRGCIRNKQPMNLFIPNSRMRRLLEHWLKGTYSKVA